MQQHLTDMGYDFVEAIDRYVIVQDPKWQNYRMYSANDKPEMYDNAHIEATHHTFDYVSEAIDFINTAREYEGMSQESEGDRWNAEEWDRD